MKEKKKLNPVVQWTKFIVVLVLWLAFLYWVKSWWGLLVVPFIFDVYITKKIKWQWWKDAEGPVKFVMSWVDALVFALVAVYFINLFFFQNYVIPSSSLEKSLLTGDYLFVSKVSYGPRIPIVVFNYPAGDTICTNSRYQAADYYLMCYSFGEQLVENKPQVDSLNPQQQWDYYQQLYNVGRQYIRDNQPEYGAVDTRPADRRENYVKRCVGLPGQTLQIKDRIIYLDGKANKEPDNVQYTYFVKLKGQLPDELLKELGISMEDLTSLNQNGYMPLTKAAVKALSARKDLVESIRLNTNSFTGEVYPLNANTGWTRDNYGPIWIPKKGASVKLSMQNIAIYDRPIRVYEDNDLQVKDGKIFINGKETDIHQWQGNRQLYVQDGLLLDDG